jgi:hypothetical protein
MIFSFLLFNRYGSCVFFEEWNRTRKVNMVEMKTNMYGLIFEMKRFIIKTSPTGYTLPPPLMHTPHTHQPQVCSRERPRARTASCL